MKRDFRFKNIKMEEKLNWWINAAWDNWDERAFGNDVDFDVPKIEHSVRPRTNQGSLGKTLSACTIYGALNQIIRLFWLDMNPNNSNKLWAEVVDYCLQFWYKIGNWWGTPDAINAVCKWWNNIGYSRFNKEKVFYVRRDYRDSKIVEALQKWHLIWFTYNLNFGEDRRKGLVYKDNYPWATWHRTNWQSTATTNPTWWASEPTADCGVYDSYYWATNQYLIRDRKKYINRWMLPASYLILPQSCMKNTVEEEKQKIAEIKAMNHVLWALSTARESVPKKYQEAFSTLAKSIRADYPKARQLENDPKKKQAEVVADTLSHLRKSADEEDKVAYAELAQKLRNKYKFE